MTFRPKLWLKWLASWVRTRRSRAQAKKLLVATPREQQLLLAKYTVIPTIRRAEWRDCDGVALVDEACHLPPEVALHTGEVEALLDDPDGEFYVAVRGSLVTGYLLAAPDRQLKVTHLLRLAVAPAFRRQGVGGDLWHSLRKRLRVSLPPRVQYRVYEDDLSTQLWLHRQGFLCRGTEKHDDGRPDVYVFCYHAPAYTDKDAAHDEAGV